MNKCETFERKFLGQSGDYPTKVTVTRCGDSINVVIGYEEGTKDRPRVLPVWMDISLKDKTFRSTFSGQ